MRANTKIAVVLVITSLATWGRDAQALSSVEGVANLGDQAPYWDTGSEVWFFPHRLGNVDNRIMLQFFDPTAGSFTPGVGGSAQAVPSFESVLTGAAAMTPSWYNLRPEQVAPGGGLVVEVQKDFNLGLWFAQVAPGFGGATAAAPAMDGGFVQRGVEATKWLHDAGAEPDDLDDIDPYDGDVENQAVDASRKLDLFASYWLSDLGVETGLRLWWGSGEFAFTPDETIGPINIDANSDPGDDAPAEENPTNVGENKYRVSELGVGLGAGYAGMPGLRLDVGLDFAFHSVTWEPNALNNYVDAGGMQVGFNLRGRYALSDQFDVGAFVGVGRRSRSLAPKRHRDGGDLQPYYDNLDEDEAEGLPNPDPDTALSFPNGTTPADEDIDSDDISPPIGIKYDEVENDFQLTLMGRFRPVSRVSIYGAMGFSRISASGKISMPGDKWFAENHGRFLALPTFQVGAAGQVTKNLLLFIAATRRWQGHNFTEHSFDDRIPDNTNAQNIPATPDSDDPAAGNEDNTNGNRRDFKEVTHNDRSVTTFGVGFRFHLDAFSFDAHLTPGQLTSGPFFLTGNATGAFAWVGVTYDWDFDADTRDTGNGEYWYSPHAAVKAPGTGGDLDKVRDRANDSQEGVKKEDSSYFDS